MTTTPKPIPSPTTPAAQPRGRGARRALTIVEVAVSVVVVAGLLVAALRTLAAVARARTVQAAQCQAPALARQLMAEIRQTRYADDLVPEGPLGPEAGEVDNKSRLGFDDVDDYAGQIELSPRARDGTSLPGAGTYRRDVAVDLVAPGSPDTVVGVDAGLKRVTVTVTGATSKATLVALVSKYGAAERTPRARTRTTYVTGVGIQLKVGNAPGRIYSGTSLANPVAVP